MATQPRRTNEDRSRETRNALVEAARTLFEDRGYAATGIEEIAARAGVTTGALYHHFGDKRGVFRAVVIDIQQDIADRVERAVEKSDDPWERFVSGWLAFNEVAPRKSIRLLMREGPAVLGSEEWRAIDDGFHREGVSTALESLMRRGIIAKRPVEPLASVLLAVSNSLGALVAESPKSRQARTEVGAIWAQLLGGLRGLDQKFEPR